MQARQRHRVALLFAGAIEIWRQRQDRDFIVTRGCIAGEQFRNHHEVATVRQLPDRNVNGRLSRHCGVAARQWP